MNTTGGLRGRVQRAGRTLRTAAIAAAVLRAIAGVLVVFLVAAFVDATVALPAGLRRFVPVAAVLAGMLIVVRRLRRSGALHGHVITIALWIESRFPALRYSLVTAVDPSLPDAAPELERQASQVSFEPEIKRATRRALTGPSIAALVCAGAIYALPGAVVARVVRPRAGDALERLAARSGGNALATIVVRVTPPAYAGLREEFFDDPVSVRALVGSAVVVEGRRSGDMVLAQLNGHSTPAAAGKDRWTTSLTMPTTAAAVRFRAGTHERLLVLEPLADSAPVVTLTLPARDSIYRRPEGIVQLAADASDDFGLANGSFEYIVSSGGGENFTFRSGNVGAAVFTGRNGALAASLSLDSLGLRPGDILHVRAVARDRNTMTGPGVGVSETRTLRIARADEYDSVAVDGAPPPEPEQNALSQRMILMLTEALARKQRGLARAVVVGEARTIAVDQTRLRKRVGQMVFTRLGEGGGEEGDALEKRLERPVNADSLLAAAERATTVQAGAALEGNEDETPVVAMNRPLLEAYNYMWSAASALEIGEPAKAIPWMQKALNALQVARAAERIYLRGRTRAVVVDIERVRLSGKDKGAPDARTPRAAADPARAARLARFDAALALASTNPGAAADSLLLLRIDLLDANRNVRVTTALEDAARALRRSGDATTALARARRALAGEAPRRVALSLWGAPW